MAGFSIELQGHGPVLDAIGATLVRIEHPRDLYDAIGLALVASTDLNFEQERGSDGSPWPPSLRALAEGGKTLTDSARLRSSITHEASDAGVAVGTNVIYAAIHQIGGTIKAKDGGALHFNIGGVPVTVASVKIPARPFLGISHDDEVEIIGLAGDWLMEPLGGADANTREHADG